MDRLTNAVPSLGRIDLAREPDFALGGLRVRPSRRELVGDGARHILQPRVMQVLVALARSESEVVSQKELISRCWGGLAVSDDAIGRCIGQLRRLAASWPAPPFVVENIPGVGYRLAGSMIELGAPQPVSRWPIGRPAVGIAAAVLVILAGVGGWFAMGRPGWPKPAEGVVVTPFNAAPGDTLARSVAEGVADRVAGTLARLDLKSLPTAVGGDSTPLQRDAAAARLGAQFALGGRVWRDGEVLRVSASIDDVLRHDVLWSAEFSRAATQADDLQDQVAARVTNVLHCTTDAKSWGGRIPPEGLGPYLRACNSIGVEPDDKVRDQFRQVVEHIPRFAKAWANLAVASAFTSGELPPAMAAAARTEARAAAEQALRLDPRSGLSFLALELLEPEDHLWARQQLMLKALAVSPDNALLSHREADLLGQVGREEEALAYDSRAGYLHPLFPDFTTAVAGDLAASGAVTEGRALMERAARIWPDNDDVLGKRIALEARFGDPRRAIALMDDPHALPASWEPSMIDRWRRYSLVRLRHDPATTRAYADALLRDLDAHRIDVNWAVRALVGLGATDAAFAAANRSSDADLLDPEVLFRPSAAAMRRDPRFMPLAAKLGLVDFWQRSGHWPDFCQAPDRPYDCRAAAAGRVPGRGVAPDRVGLEAKASVAR